MKLATFLAENSARNINTACCIEQVQKAGKKERKKKQTLSNERSPSKVFLVQCNLKLAPRVVFLVVVVVVVYFPFRL